MTIEDLRDRLAWLAMVGVILGSGAMVQAQEPGPGKAAQQDFLYFFNDGAPGEGDHFQIRLSDHWIGISGDAADQALRAQLKLPEGQGYLVTQVQPDSPAAKAQVEKFDVLLLVGGKNVGELKDLVAAVDANKDKEVELTLLRGGEKRTVRLTPTKRPEAKALTVDGPDPQEVRHWINRMPGQAGRVQLFNFGPGMMADHFAFFKEKAEFPENLTVLISKRGNTPTKVVVKRGDEEWTTTDNKLDALPEDVRPHVAGLLGLPAAGPHSAAWEFRSTVPAHAAAQMRIEALGPALNERLDDLDKQIDDLRKSLEELRKASQED